jgi:hypothetical protein
MKAPNLVKHLTLILTTTLIVVGFPALAVDPVECGLDRGDQLHGRIHDQIRDRDRLHDGALVLLGNDGDRLRTRDRLRDQDCDLICPTASEVWNRLHHRNTFQYRNQYMLEGTVPPIPLGITLMPLQLF